MSTNLNTFISICGPTSANIQEVYYPDSISYVNDGQIPNFSFEQFTTESNICVINNYSLYYDYEGTDLITEINSNWINEDNRIQFQLLEEKEIKIDYYLKIEADGGDVLWIGPKTFESECGPQSGRVERIEIPAELLD